MIQNVAITGGSGFLGNEIARQCRKNGWNVRAISRRVPAQNLDPAEEKIGVPALEFFKADISEAPEKLAEIFAGTDAVFHAAAKTGLCGKKKDFWKTNVAGTKNGIQACKKAGVKILIFTSSPSVVFNEMDISGGDETLPLCESKLSVYAETKTIAETQILDANCENLRTVALRPHLIWGKNDPHLIPKIIEQAAQNRLRIVGNGENKVDLTHVENAAHAHILAAKILGNAVFGGENFVPAEKISGKAYFISDGAPVLLWAWINDFFKKIGVPELRKDRAVPFKSALFAGMFLELFWKIFGVAGTPPMTRFAAFQLSKNHWFKIDAARKDLAYAPIADPEEKLAELVNFYKGKS